MIFRISIGWVFFRIFQGVVPFLFPSLFQHAIPVAFRNQNPVLHVWFARDKGQMAPAWGLSFWWENLLSHEKKHWLFGVYRGLYYPDILGL